MTFVTKNDILTFKETGSWRTLESVANKIIENVSLSGGKPFVPVLGGGTRLMLELNHRISHDIDLFHHDAQWISYITPRKNDFVENISNDYEEGGEYIKIKLPEGEIDFITSTSLLDTKPQKSKDSTFLLESMDEVIAKKLFHRGCRMKVRDLFDWYCVGNFSNVIDKCNMGELLQSRTDEIQQVLTMMKTSSTAFSDWNKIQTSLNIDLIEAIEWSLEELKSYKCDKKNKNTNIYKKIK